MKMRAVSGSGDGSSLPAHEDAYGTLANVNRGLVSRYGGRETPIPFSVSLDAQQAAAKAPSWATRETPIPFSMSLDSVVRMGLLETDRSQTEGSHYHE
jgi:hypothetical protein